MQLKMSGLLVAVFALFGSTAYVSMRFFDSHERQAFVGLFSIASLIAMFASPLLIIVSSYETISHILILDYSSSSLMFLQYFVPEIGD